MMSNMMQIFSATLIWLSGLQPTRSVIIGYDCSNAFTLYSKPLQDMLSMCSYQVFASVESDVSLVYKNDSYEPLTLVRQCSVRYNESAPGASHLMSAWTEKSIGREACLQAHKTEKMDLHGRTVDLEVSGTNRKRVYLVDGRICTDIDKCPNAMIRDYEITLTTHVAHMSKEYNILRLDKRDDVWCSYDKFQCKHAGANLFWEDESAGDLCGPEYSLVFTGKMEFLYMVDGELFAVADIDGYRFVFELSKQHLLCSKRAYHTQDSNWRIVVEDSPNIRRIDLDVELFGNKFDFEKKAGKEASAIELVEKRCKFWRDKKLKAFSDRVIGESCLYHREGVKCEISDQNVITLKQCHRVPIRIRFTQECFDCVAVYDQWGNEKFLTPFSRILVDSAKAVPCKKVGPPKSELGYTFVDFIICVSQIGAFCSFIWMLRSSNWLIQQYYRKLINMFRQPESGHVNSEQADQRSDPSKFRKLVDAFLVHVEPPFHLDWTRD